MTVDWNASLYHQISEPQFAWGMTVLSRLRLAGTEHALDVGCGTGRLTMELARRLPRGRVTATDRSGAMVEKAAALLHRNGIPTVQADATRLPFFEVLDVVFSTATFHWVLDHDALFQSLFRALRPGGRLHAQCGGGPNLAHLFRRARFLMREAPFAPHFASWREPWFFGGAEDTAARLESAGFGDVVTGLEAAPVSFDTQDAFQTFIDHVCIRPYLHSLPEALRKAFSDELVRQASSDTPPFTLDYWRLNVAGTRPMSS